MRASKSTPKKTLRSDEGGAALPEFAIAVFPLTFMFFGLAQVCEIQIGHILMHHAAIIGARCATVIKGPHLPGTYVSNNDGKSDNGDAEGECTKAATMALGPLSKNFTGIAVIPTYTGTDHFGDVDTTVLATFQCGVPLGQHLVCNGDSVNFSFEIKLPHQGADYVLSGANCGGSCASNPQGGGGVDIPNGNGSNGSNGGSNSGGSNGGPFQGGGGTFGGGGASGSY
jgi:uncharacterized membrane protein YgcG